MALRVKTLPGVKESVWLSSSAAEEGSRDNVRPLRSACVTYTIPTIFATTLYGRTATAPPHCSCGQSKTGSGDSLKDVGRRSLVPAAALPLPRSVPDFRLLKDGMTASLEWRRSSSRWTASNTFHALRSPPLAASFIISQLSLWSLLRMRCCLMSPLILILHALSVGVFLPVGFKGRREAFFANGWGGEGGAVQRKAQVCNLKRGSQAGSKRGGSPSSTGPC